MEKPQAGGRLTRAPIAVALRVLGGLAPAVSPKTGPFCGACRGASKKRPRPVRRIQEMIPIPTRATTTRGWARWGGGGQDLGTAYVVVAEASCPVICHSRPPDQDLIT